MTAFCAHPGCLAALHRSNVSGVCRDHMHGVACLCARCRAHPTPAQREFSFAMSVAAGERHADELPLIPPQSERTR